MAPSRLEALRIFGLVGHQGDARLFHPPITLLIRSSMASYFDYQGVNSGHLEAGPSSFVRPLNLSDRKSGNTSIPSRASGASGLTYATNGSAPVPDESQQSPAEPIMGVPTPVMPSKGLQMPGDEEYDDEDDDEDPEYMMVDADLSMVSQFGAQSQPPPPPLEQEPQLHNKPVPVKVQGGRKGFVGGFVSGLRRLPRMMLRNRRGQTVQRQPSHDTVLELPGFGEDSPGYDPFRGPPPPIPSSTPFRPPPIPRNPPSVPASHPVTSMHYSHYTHDERSESPTSRDPRDFDDEELDHGHSGSDDEDDDSNSMHKPLSTIAHSTHQSTRHSTNHSTHHSTHRSTHHSTHHSNHLSVPKSNPNSGHQSNHPSTHHSTPHRSTTPSRQTAVDGDTTLNHQTQNGEPEVVVANPLPTSDYKSMGPEPPSSSSSSVTSNVNRIQRFVNDVYNLPWVATKVAVDFYPERDGRMYHGMDPDEKRSPKPLKSWYPPLHKDLDLLADAPLPQSAPVMAHRRQDGHRRALTESTISPASAGITQSATPSTTYSTPHRYSVTSEPIPRHARHARDFRHSHRHRRRHRDHSRPHSPPIYPVLASPQHVYLYPGHASPPIMPIPQPALGSSPSSPRSRRGVASPMPVLMISVPPPVYQPMTGFPYPTPQLTQSQPAQSQPAQSQPATSPPAPS